MYMSLKDFENKLSRYRSCSINLSQVPNQCLHWCWHHPNVSNGLGKSSKTKQQTCSSSRISEMAWWLDVLGLTMLTDKLMLSRNSLRWTSNSLELCTTNIIPPTWKIKDKKINKKHTLSHNVSEFFYSLKQLLLCHQKVWSEISC